jgi:hypothetical protein
MDITPDSRSFIATRFTEDDLYRIFFPPYIFNGITKHGVSIEKLCPQWRN